jgi:hypothetical protein
MAPKPSRVASRRSSPAVAGARGPAGPRVAGACCARRMLRSSSFAAAKAASAVRDRSLCRASRTSMRACFERFLREPSARPTRAAQAKLAALEALDFLESLDPEPFHAGVDTFPARAGLGPAGGHRQPACGPAPRSALRAWGTPTSTCGWPTARRSRGGRAAGGGGGGGPPAGSRGREPAPAQAEGGRRGPQVTLPASPGSSRWSRAGRASGPSPAFTRTTRTCARSARSALGQSRREDAGRPCSPRSATSCSPPRRALRLRAGGMHRSDRALGALLKVIAEWTPLGRQGGHRGPRLPQLRARPARARRGAPGAAGTSSPSAVRDAFASSGSG